MEKTQDLFVRNLVRALEAVGWGASELGNAAGFTRQYAHAVIKGDSFPGTDNLDRIAKALGIHVSELFLDPGKKREVTPLEALKVIENALKTAEKSHEPKLPERVATIAERLAALNDDKLISDIEIRLNRHRDLIASRIELSKGKKKSC